MTTARSITFVLGFALAIAGLLPVALAFDWLIVPAGDLPVPLWMMGCGGACFIFAGTSMMLPDSLPRPRGLLAAMAMTALAVIFDWIAFGHLEGGWRFILASLMNSLALRQNAAHNVVVLFATLLTLLSLFAWMQWFRNLAEKEGTPLKRPGRRGKAQESVE